MTTFAHIVISEHEEFLLKINNGSQALSTTDHSKNGRSSTRRVIIHKHRSVEDRWATISKYGTNETHLEPAVLQEGHRFYQEYKKQLLHRPHPHNKDIKMLCTAFVGNISIPNRWVIEYNIAHSHPICDWAFIAYEEIDKQFLSSLCDIEGVIYCKYSMALNSSNSKTHSRPKSIPKSVLYLDLLSLLQVRRQHDSPYHSVFLLDEDIYLGGFNLAQFIKYWRCSEGIGHAPLIVQPLVAGVVKQYIPWLNVDAWKKRDDQNFRKSRRTGPFVQEVAFIEQQVPMFNGVFFEWFLSSILSRIRSIALKNGADWGHDRCWCSAAQAFANEVLLQPNRYGCGIFIIPKQQVSNVVYHLNFRSMKLKREQQVEFREKAANSVSKYIELFPTWVVTDILNTKNPFSLNATIELRSAELTCS